MKRQPADVLIGAGVAVVAMAIFGLLSGPSGMLELVGLCLTGMLVLHLLSRDSEGARLLGTLLMLAVLLRHLMPRRYKRAIRQWEQDGVAPKPDQID